MDRYVVAITWPRAWKIYWAHLWRGFLLFGALTLAAMLTYGLVSPFLRLVIGLGEIAVRLVLILAIMLYAFTWSMKRALQAPYADFWINVVPADAAGTASSPASATLNLWHALAVWWAVFWRSMLLAIPLNLLSSYLIAGTPFPRADVPWSELAALCVVQTAISFATATWAVRIALTLRYGTWRLELVPPLQASLAPLVAEP